MTQLLSSSDISIFSLEISKFCYIKKYRYRLHFDISFLILLTFFEPLKNFLINIVTNLMMLGKIATLGLLKTKLFWNKSIDVIISVYDFIDKILSHDLNNILDMLMLPKFDSSSISMRKVIITSFTVLGSCNTYHQLFCISKLKHQVYDVYLLGLVSHVKLQHDNVVTKKPSWRVWKPIMLAPKLKCNPIKPRVSLWVQSQ